MAQIIKLAQTELRVGITRLCGFRPPLRRLFRLLLLNQQIAQMRLRGHAAALCRTFAPLLRLRQIGFHALPHFVHDGNIVAGLQIALFRQLAPFGQGGGKIALFISQ